MIQVSEQAAAVIESDSRKFQSRFLLSGTVISGEVRSVKTYKGSCGDAQFAPGLIYSSYLDVVLDYCHESLEGKELLYQIGVVIDEENTEWYDIGYFTVCKPSKSVYTTSFQALGRISARMGGLYSSNLTFPASIQSVLDEISSATGVEIDASEFDTSGMIETKPVGYLHREVLAFIAGIFMGYATEDASGKVVISKYKTVGNIVETDGDRTTILPTFADLDTVITGIKVIVSDGNSDGSEEETSEEEPEETVSEVSFSSGSVNVIVSNPFMTQALFDANVNNLIGLTYRSGTVSISMGDFRIEPFDCMKVTDSAGEIRLVPCMSVVHTFESGLTTEIIAPSIENEEGEETGFRGALGQTIERLTTDMVVAKEMISKRITADEAILKFASIERAEILEANIGQLSGDYAEFKTVTTEEFSAQRAVIDEVSGDLAAYKTAISDELLVAKGWMAEGAIGNAQISDLDAVKIKSGILDTALVTVKGTNGNLQIVDNTISISDSNHVRVQVGKDASGDYTLAVWDAAGKLIWDALGATENTIQRPIIRDEVVADDAAIKGTKLDIESVVTAVNGASTKISGTVVQVGDKTLNVALSEQETTITEYGGQISDHEARITANEESILLKVSTQDFSSYKTTVNAQIDSAKSEVIGYTDAQITTVNESLSNTNQEISVMKGQIALKVEQTDIDTAVQSIEVGGRNLIRNSNFSNGIIYWAVERGSGSIVDDSVYGQCFQFKVVSQNRILNSVSNVWKAGQVYTYSFMAKANVEGVGIRPSRSLADYGETHILTTEWVRHTGVITSTLTADTGTLSFTCDSGDATYYITNVKLEKGNKATDWTPAPEDIDSSINAVDSKFSSYSTTAQMNSAIALAKNEISLSVSETYATIDNVAGIETRVSDAEALISVHSNEIALTVRQDGVISAINQSAEEVKIQAEKITLAGATIADEFTATNLHITGDSTFDGVLNGATGTFDGDITAETLSAKDSINIYSNRFGHVSLKMMYLDDRIINQTHYPRFCIGIPRGEEIYTEPDDNGFTYFAGKFGGVEINSDLYVSGSLSIDGNVLTPGKTLFIPGFANTNGYTITKNGWYGVSPASGLIFINDLLVNPTAGSSVIYVKQSGWYKISLRLGETGSSPTGSVVMRLVEEGNSVDTGFIRSSAAYGGDNVEVTMIAPMDAEQGYSIYYKRNDSTTQVWLEQRTAYCLIEQLRLR